MYNRAVFITAFKDIRRDSWNSFSRTLNDYIVWFGNLQRYPIRIICFCDTQLQKVLEERYGYVECYAYDDMNTYFKDYDIHQQVMDTPFYKSLFGERTNPEFLYPEYNIVNHNKSVFVKRAKDMFPYYSHYIWIDFGFKRSESAVLPFRESLLKDVIEFESETIPVDIVRQMSLYDLFINPQYYCLIRGSMFIVPFGLVDWYHRAYADMIQHYIDNACITSDQPMVPQLYLKHTDKFSLYESNDWFQLLNHYC